jgi:hypothetical protein
MLLRCSCVWRWSRLLCGDDHRNTFLGDAARRKDWFESIADNETGIPASTPDVRIEGSQRGDFKKVESSFVGDGDPFPAEGCQ